MTAWISEEKIEEYMSKNQHEKYLGLRAFTDSPKMVAYQKQKGVCPKCKKHFAIEEMEGENL